MTDKLVPNLVCPKMLTVLPKRCAPLRDSDEPNCTKSSTENVEPMREKDRKLMEDPKMMKSRTEMVFPRFISPVTETDEPILANCLSDKDDDNCTKSRTVSEEPSRP